jgi:alcohol dehydrogenase, propanol-preferring
MAGIPSSMKAVQYHQDENVARVNIVPVPTPKPFELLVKTSCASLCRSDLMNFEPDDHGLKPKDAKPLTMGHEAAGVVVGVGVECSGFSVGDEIGFLPNNNVCFDCDACQVHPMWCTTYGSCRMHGHSAEGFFQEYIAIHYRNAIVLPSGLSAVEAAPLFCAGVTGYHGIADLGIPAGSWVAIIGVGGLGHLGVQYAKAKGYKVVGLDIVDSQLQEATECGADHVFNTRTDPSYVESVRKVTGGKGCNAVVNYTSSKASYDRAPDVLRVGGILMVVGHPQEMLTFSTIDLGLRRFVVLGASNSTPSNMKECIDFSVAHGIKPHTTYFDKLEDIHQMMDLMRSGKARGRLAIRFV